MLLKRKTGIIISVYAVAAIITLSVFSAVVYQRLTNYRRVTAYGSRQAFEETVRAVDELSSSLKKSVYASDGSMCGSICAEAYANALSAEATLSSLPFSTQELEQTSAFLNTAGDYAYTLCAESAEKGFDEEQLEQLTQLSAAAADYASMLRELQGSVNNGLTIIDRMEQPVQNVDADETPRLSAALLGYEEKLAQMEPLSYDGKYCKSESKGAGELTEEEILEAAASAAGVEARQLKQEYAYEGTEGRRCYSAGELLICVSSRGLESMAQSRLVGDAAISAEEAVELAEAFLTRQGYEELKQESMSEGGGVLSLRYNRQQDGAVVLDSYVGISIALDDGSIYMFNALNYCDEKVEVEWKTNEEQAREKLTGNLEANDARKVIIKSAGGRDMACYEFFCTGENGESVMVYVDGESGSQCRIEL